MPKGKPVVSKDFLESEYLIANKSAARIAAEVGTSPPTIGRLLVKYGIPLKRSVVPALPEKVGKWTLLKRFKRSGVWRWECRCECGVVKPVHERYLLTGRSSSCLRCAIPTSYKHSRWTGCGEISGRRWREMKYNAEQRNMKRKKFLITPDFAWGLFLRQERTCALSGLPLRFKTSHVDPEPETASLDRINSDGDYTEDNVQWVHKEINRMKMSLNEERFVELCRLVAKKHNSP